MKLVIFAGVLGTRISEESDYILEPMVKIGKKPIFIRYYLMLFFLSIFRFYNLWRL